jgi:hypothetical protein
MTHPPTPPQGSSVPIPIGMPMVGKWRKEQDASSGADATQDEYGLQYPGTFIPPHQLSHQQEHFMSVAGGASSVKKDRLRARNAILKATGFVEQGMQAHSLQVRACAPCGLFRGGFAHLLPSCMEDP